MRKPRLAKQGGRRSVVLLSARRFALSGQASRGFGREALGAAAPRGQSSEMTGPRALPALAGFFLARSAGPSAWFRALWRTAALWGLRPNPAGPGWPRWASVHGKPPPGEAAAGARDDFPRFFAPYGSQPGRRLTLNHKEAKPSARSAAAGRGKPLSVRLRHEPLAYS
jgi:hypothetical protein